MKQERMWSHGLMAGIVWAGLILISSTVYADCTVSTTSINFGSYDVLFTAATTGTGSLTVSCNKKTNGEITIGAGSNSVSFFPRRMKHVYQDESLDYNLYTSAAMVQVWGDGTDGTSSVNFAGNKRNPVLLTIYGKIAPLQNVPAGSYSEPLVVTIIF